VNASTHIAKSDGSLARRRRDQLRNGFAAPRNDDMLPFLN
jgi:hypothetical protein